MVDLPPWMVLDTALLAGPLTETTMPATIAERTVVDMAEAVVAVTMAKAHHHTINKTNKIKDRAIHHMVAHLAAAVVEGAAAIPETTLHITNHLLRNSTFSSTPSRIVPCWKLLPVYLCI